MTCGLAFALAAVFAGACTNDPAPAKDPTISLSGSYLSRTPGEVRGIFVLGERYSLVRSEPCALAVGELRACMEEGTLTLTTGSVALREKTTGRETKIPLEVVRTASATLATRTIRPAGPLVGGGEPLSSGGDVEAFRAGGQAFERETLVTPTGPLTRKVPCAEVEPPDGNVPPRCMPRSQCDPWARSQGMRGMSMLLSNDCNVEADEICCGLMEAWTPCQQFQNSSCEAPENCAQPRWPVPGKTNCGDALRPGTICCADPLVW